MILLVLLALSLGDASGATLPAPIGQAPRAGAHSLERARIANEEPDVTAPCMDRDGDLCDALDALAVGGLDARRENGGDPLYADELGDVDGLDADGLDAGGLDARHVDGFETVDTDGLDTDGLDDLDDLDDLEREELASGELARADVDGDPRDDRARDAWRDGDPAWARGTEVAARARSRARRQAVLGGLDLTLTWRRTEPIASPARDEVWLYGTWHL